MLRTRIHSVLQLPATAPFHTTPSTHVTRRALLARASKKQNVERRAQHLRTAEATKPHPVLGHCLNNDAKWHNCDLAKVLIDQRELQSTPVLPLNTRASPTLPNAFQWGIGGDPAAQHLLFDALPEASEQVPLYHRNAMPAAQEMLYLSQQQELHNVHILSRIVDLRNASAGGIAFENRRRCVAAFSEPGTSNDSGRPEVQAALLTMKIRKLWDHLQRNRKDIANKRSLRMLVHKRAKILKYLKRLDRQRYETVLGRLGIEEGAIEGELII